jgi:hypothetical protein
MRKEVKTSVLEVELKLSKVRNEAAMVVLNYAVKQKQVYFEEFLNTEFCVHTRSHPA